MEDSGIMDIGSHTVNHTSLATVSIESARWEITESLKALQTHLKKKPVVISHILTSRIMTQS